MAKSLCAVLMVSCLVSAMSLPGRPKSDHLQKLPRESKRSEGCPGINLAPCSASNPCGKCDKFGYDYKCVPVEGFGRRCILCNAQDPCINQYY
ncbi:hypothetical protein ABFA07_005325 [Porites harrisoni]